MMTRRKVIGAIAVLGGAWIHGAIGASAQEQGRTYRLGFLVPIGRQAPGIVAFFDELRSHGFIEGKNLVVVPNGFEVRDRFDEHAAALVEAAPDAIVSGADLATRALQRATRTIPLIGMTEDMVAAGLVNSLARPGGNTTGISLLSPELDGKRQEILMELVPEARRIGALADVRITPPSHLQALQHAARARGIDLSIFGVSESAGIATAVDRAKASGIDALNVLATPLFFAHADAVIERVVALRLPTMHQWPELAEHGALAGYGPRFTQIQRQRAGMVVKVLRGAKPADLPVEQPTKFELAVNLKTARALGIAIPPSILLRADEVIE
jgi:putative ABC transport system substrate-binding protein